RQRPPVAALGAPDADSEAQEVLRPERLRDRAQTVVTGEAAALSGLQPPEIEVALVVDDEDRVGLDLEEARRGRDGAAGLVHVRLGLQQRDAVAVEAHFRQAAAELRAPGAAMTQRELVQ